MRVETEHAQAIVDADHYRAFFCQTLAAMRGSRASAASEPSAMEPHHHRPPLLRGLGRCPDIQVKAIFTGGLRLLVELHLIKGADLVFHLHAYFRELIRLA